MKYVIVIPDGCADEPQASLDGRTPLAAAETPAADEIARLGVVGRARHVPDTLPPGSAVANMSLLGYDPLEHFTGRAPLEAAAGGIELADDDWAVRCNLVTIEEQVMCDFTAGHITTEEAGELLSAANELLAQDDALAYVPGVSYRNLLICRAAHRAVPFTADTRTTPPHDLIDHPVLDDYPRGPGSDLLIRLMSDSMKCFAEHPVNVRRRSAGLLPATNVWLWGQGRRPSLARFADVYGKTGTMITAVDLLRGLATLIGWRRVEVAGATGYTDTDYAAKGRAAITALSETDVVCVHVEATDEASHEGDTAAKVQALEEIDRHVTAPLLDELKRQGDYRILVTPDHPTPLRTKTHSHGPVPLTMCGTGIAADALDVYTEEAAAKSELSFDPGFELMQYFLGDATG